jgi:hypothetical protein
VPVARPLPATLSHRFGPQIGAGSIQVSVVEHKFGQLEASILADTKGHLSDVRIPAIQKSCEVAGLRVVRTSGYLAIAPGNEEIFTRLQCIFPSLAGWLPIFTEEQPASGIDNLTVLSLTQTEEARYHLAQSVLLLNVSGEIPDAMLQDAALYGVPCIGTAGSYVQATLWPDLTTNDSDQAFRMARSLLTNAARLRKVSARGRNEGKLAFDTNEQDAATWLRRLHSSEKDSR